MKKEGFIPFSCVKLEGGFWRDRYNLNKNVSIAAVKARFEDTARFDALRFNYLKTGKHLDMVYDSDVAKWIEAVAYLMENRREEFAEEERFIDELIDCMSNAQREDGYLNPYFQQKAPELIYKNRNYHELYCTGHLIEAAIAYDHATGKNKFLSIMEKNCDCIERAFFIENTAAFQTPGHEEIELALFKLWRYTGKEKYKSMAEKFLTLRGNNSKDEYIYKTNAEGCQDDQTIYELKIASGHCVRALYLYSAVADMALENGDKRLKASLDNVWKDITETKMYITGGVGSTHTTESFTVPYDLPNNTAYSESCCAIAFCLFAMRMRKLEKNAKYGALIERELYNNILSSSSLDGKSFFYTNPLEIALEEYGREKAVSDENKEWLPVYSRSEVFGCSCCPPNINRFFAMFPETICYEEENGLTVEQYIPSKIDTSFGELSIKGEYALTGKVNISCEDYSANTICLRVPEWCNNFSVIVDGIKVNPQIKDRYVTLSVNKAFDIALDFNIKAKFICSDPRVRANVGRTALTFGPVVYCLESVDNGERLNGLSVDVSAADSAKIYKDFHGLNSIEISGYRDEVAGGLYFDAAECSKKEQTLKFIPYFAFANRGVSDMLVWVRKA